MKNRWNCVGLSFVMAAVVAHAEAVACQPVFVVEELSTLGDNGANVSSINDVGQIAGTSERDDGLRRAVLWTDGEILDLGDLSTGDWVRYDVGDINNHGVVVGSASDGFMQGLQALFTWNDARGMDEVLRRGSLSFASVAINDSGQTAYNWLANDWSFNQAFLSENGKSIALTSPHGPGAWARGMNAHGSVVGYSGGFDFHQMKFFDDHAAYWPADGEAIDLGTLGGLSSRAASINDAHQIVGNSEVANGENHMFLWQQGRMFDVGAFGEVTTRPYSINNRRMVVGYTEFMDSRRSAFIWIDDVFHDLNDLVPVDTEFTLTAAVDINDRAEIVADGKRAGD